MIDLTGQKFGRLTVIRKAHRKIDHHVAWVCQCVCGNKTETTTRNLQSGRAKSCGCLRRENSSKLRRVNLLGKRFGRLLVIEEEPSKVGDHIVFWKCQCDCGNIVLHNTGTLTSGNTQSCGCLRKDNLKKLIDNNAKDGTMLNQIADTRKKTRIIKVESRVFHGIVVDPNGQLKLCSSKKQFILVDLTTKGMPLTLVRKQRKSIFTQS